MAGTKSRAGKVAQVIPFRPKVVDEQLDAVDGLRDVVDELSQDSRVEGTIVLIARKGKPLGMRTTGQFSVSGDQTILALLKSLHVLLHTETS